MPYEAWDESRATAIVEGYRRERGGLMPALHGLMEHFGYIDEGAVPILALAFNLSRAEVHGTITFYRDFRREPPARHTVRVCRAEACQAVGAEDLADHACRSLALDFGETSEDGAVALEQVFCLGNCALSPAVMVDDRLYGKVDADRFDRLMVSTVGEGRP